MKTETPCAPQTCDTTMAERPRYFPRQIITADDLSLDQEYARNARRLHNRMLHGWGVVCGAKVCPVPCTNGSGQGYQPWQVSVCPGYVLGPCGDEILIDCCKTVDLRTSGTNAVTRDPCVQIPDPWCSDVFAKPLPVGPFYVGVKYKQIMARPVRVQPVGCGCDDTNCEYSRWRDGYEIGVLQNYPCSQTPPDIDPATGQPDLNLLVRGDMMDCPVLPKNPWVVLAVVKVDADGTIQSIDNCACRRWVVSFGNFWWGCHTTQIAIQSFDSDAGVDFQNLKPDSKTALTAKGHISAGALAAPPDSTASLGQGITIKNFQVIAVPAGQDFTLTFVVESDTQPAAQPGFRNLTLKNVDCSIAIFPNAIQVVAKAAPTAKAQVKKKVK